MPGGADLEPNQPWAVSCDTCRSRPFGHSHRFHVTFPPQSLTPSRSRAVPLCAPLPARRPPMQARSKRRQRLHKVSTSCCTYAAASYCSRAIERLSVSIILACRSSSIIILLLSPSPTPSHSPSLIDTHSHPTLSLTSDHTAQLSTCIAPSDTADYALTLSNKTTRSPTFIPWPTSLLFPDSSPRHQPIPTWRATTGLRS